MECEYFPIFLQGALALTISKPISVIEIDLAPRNLTQYNRSRIWERAMVRKVFFSFHFDNDFWRTQQVRNIGALEGQTLYTPNAWEEIKRKGNDAIEKWIDDNIFGKSCVVVLVGAETDQRPWVIREIVKGWDSGKGILGIRVNKLLDRHSNSSVAGGNPFDKVGYGNSGRQLSSIVQLIDPIGLDSKAAYASISNNIERWIEDAITIRNKS
jgi:hypothetical protein